MKAKDLMVKPEGHLSPEDSLICAAVKMKNTKRNGESVGVRALPVLEAGGKFIGLVTMGDILKAMMPKYLDLAQLGDFTWDGMVEDLAKKVCRKTVKEMMNTEVITVNEEAPLMSCIDHIIHDHIKRLPVVNDEGRLVGIVYERDVFYAVTRTMENSKECSI